MTTERGPQFRPGQGLGSIKASDLNRIVKLAEQATNLIGVTPIIVDNPGGSRRIRLSPEWLAGVRAQLLPLVITAPIEPDVSRITARAVRYAALPPEQDVGGCSSTTLDACQYVWDGDDFTAYPDFGYQAQQYAGFVWSPVDDGPPRLETPILKAYRCHGYWLVQMPQDAEKLVVLKGYTAPGSLFVQVHEVVPEVSGGTWTGNFIPIGDEITVNVWPLMVAWDFEPFRVKTWPPVWEKTTILPLTFTAGVWWLKQRPKRAIIQPSGAVHFMEGVP